MPFSFFIRVHAHFREQECQSLPHTVPDVNQPGMAAARGGRDRTRPLSANTIRERAQQSLEESAKRLRTVEVREESSD